MVLGTPPKATGLAHGGLCSISCWGRRSHKAVSSHDKWGGTVDQGDGIRVSEPCLLRSSLYWLVPGCSPVFLQLYPQPLWVITSTTVFHRLCKENHTSPSGSFFIYGEPGLVGGREGAMVSGTAAGQGAPQLKTLNHGHARSCLSTWPRTCLYSTVTKSPLRVNWCHHQLS